MTDITPEMRAPVSNRHAVATHMNKILYRLSAGVTAGTSSSKADLARLRRAVNEAPGSVPEVWGITLGDLPVQLVGRSDAPSPGETAVHAALSLFAIAQQGKSEVMHVKNQGMGTAVRKFILLNNPSGGFDDDSPVLRRFNVLSTSDSVDEVLWHLRSLITQLRGASIGLDFADLASDIYDFCFPEARNRVRLKWGRQLYTTPRSTTADSTTAS